MNLQQGRGNLTNHLTPSYRLFRSILHKLGRLHEDNGFERFRRRIEAGG